MAFLNETKKAMDLQFQPRIVLPGDVVTEDVTQVNKIVKLGTGLEERNQKIVATHAGMLRYRPPNRFWVDFHHKRYLPTVDDCVIGKIEERNMDFYRLSIGGSTKVVLPTLAFDGASKRNRPNCQVGALVYVRMRHLSEALEPEVTCEATANEVKRDWMTGQCIYGELVGGHVIRVSIPFAKSCMKDECAVLDELARQLSFEVAIGLNGFIWVKAAKPSEVVLIANAILNAEHLSTEQTSVMVEQLVAQFRPQ